MTTEDERRAYRIVQAIGAEITDTSRIVMRDAKSYCAILLDNNNRKPICRFYFMKTKMAVAVFTPTGERREDIKRLEDIYQFRGDIQAAIRQYEQPSPDPQEAKAEAEAGPQSPPPGLGD